MVSDPRTHRVERKVRLRLRDHCEVLTLNLTPLSLSLRLVLLTQPLRGPLEKIYNSDNKASGA